MLHKKYLINSVMNINNTEHYPAKILDKKNSLNLYIRLRIYWFTLYVTIIYMYLPDVSECLYNFYGGKIYNNFFHVNLTYMRTYLHIQMRALIHLRPCKHERT